MIRPGAFVCIVGPSGVGKDSIIAGASRALAGSVAFPRRVVTRPASAFEDHDSLGEAEFLALERAGDFALSWAAHGLRYGIRGEVAALLAGGTTAVCNISRAAIPMARRAFAEVRVVAITAPAGIIAARLMARGREDAGMIDARRAHEAGLDVPVEADLTVVNDRSLAEAVADLVAFLAPARTEAEPRG